MPSHLLDPPWYLVLTGKGCGGLRVYPPECEGTRCPVSSDARHRVQRLQVCAMTLPMTAPAPILLALAGTLALGGESTAWFKCPWTESLPGYEDQVVVLIDGRTITTLEALEESGGLEEYEPGWVGITCWDPETGAFHSRTGINIVYVVTKPIADPPRIALEKLQAAQAAYHEANSEYAEAISALAGPDLPADTDVELRGTKTGWTATSPAGHGLIHCHVFHGDAAPRLPGMSAGSIRCVPDYEVAGRTLREAYDRR